MSITIYNIDSCKWSTQAINSFETECFKAAISMGNFFWQVFYDMWWPENWKMFNFKTFQDEWNKRWQQACTITYMQLNHNNSEITACTLYYQKSSKSIKLTVCGTAEYKKKLSHNGYHSLCFHKSLTGTNNQHCQFWVNTLTNVASLLFNVICFLIKYLITGTTADRNVEAEMHKK